MEFIWDPYSKTEEENARWIQLRAIEWGKWPVFVFQPFGPILLIYFSWWKIILMILILTVIWSMIRYKYVSIALADIGALLAKLKWVTAICCSVFFFMKTQYLLGFLALGWPVISLALLFFTGVTYFGRIERLFYRKMECLKVINDDDSLDVSDELGIKLPRVLEGIQLETDISCFRNSRDWSELPESMKKSFATFLPDEMIFTKQGIGKSFFCGLTNNKVYKIAVVVAHNEVFKYVAECREKYGDPVEENRNWFIWEDEKTVFEISIKSSQGNIMLTDKSVFRI